MGRHRFRQLQLHRQMSLPDDDHPHGLLKTFTRAQIASAIASVIDFAVLIFSVEGVGIWYVAATAIGAASGAMTNYIINRHWSFRARAEGMRTQALRYALVSLGSLIINSAGVYMVTELGGAPYVISKVIVSFLVGLLFNFPLHRRFVFRGTASRP